MKFEPFNQSIVILANNFNPSLIRESWLTEQGIVKKDEFTPGCIFTESIVQVNTNKFNLLVFPQQLQFIPNSLLENSKTNLSETITKFVKALPHTPYSAAGANFNWNINLNGESLSKLSKKLFYRTDNPLFKNFDTQDANFGVYLSKDMGQNVRLKLNIIPVKIQPIGQVGKEPFETLQCAFNFHIDFKGVKPIDELLAFIENWNTYLEESEKIKLSLQ